MSASLLRYFLILIRSLAELDCHNSMINNSTAHKTDGASVCLNRLNPKEE